MMKTQSIEVAKQNQRTVLDAETLMKTTREFKLKQFKVYKKYMEGRQKETYWMQKQKLLNARNK